LADSYDGCVKQVNLVYGTGFEKIQKIELIWGTLLMRLKELEIDSQNILKLDIMELPKSCVIVLSEGKVRLAELPPFAETKIYTHQGKVQRVKWDEGETF